MLTIMGANSKAPIKSITFGTQRTTAPTIFNQGSVQIEADTPNHFEMLKSQVSELISKCNTAKKNEDFPEAGYLEEAGSAIDEFNRLLKIARTEFSEREVEIDQIEESVLDTVNIYKAQEAKRQEDYQRAIANSLR